MINKDTFKKNIKNIFIIAEAGVNHNGELQLAKKLIDVAKDSGANAIKFQTWSTEKCISKHAKKANYQKKSINDNETQFEMVKKLELTHEMHNQLFSYCTEREILFLSSPFDCESIDYLERLNMPIFKIPSGEITHVPYLRKIGALNKPTILSTGMCTLDDIEFGMTTLLDAGLDKTNLSLLHCTTEYPCPFEDVNLNAMKTMQDQFELPVGYSDHTEGIEISLAAVAMGATIIEKHFTIDKSMPGPDHKASLNPTELKALVKGVRTIELAMGSGKKEPSPSEKKNIPIARKSIVAKTKIQKGERFTKDNLICMRPGNYYCAANWDMILGKVSSKAYNKDAFIDSI